MITVQTPPSLTLPHKGGGAILLLWTFLMFGCSSNDADYQQKFQFFLKKSVSGAQEAFPALPHPGGTKFFHYSAYDKRDPFVLKPGRTETTARVREPLEAYPLDTLRMVGTLAKKGEQQAIMKASSDKSIHTVRAGSYLGKNSGHVVTVTDTEVRLVETLIDADGSSRERTASILLTTDEKKRTPSDQTRR